MRASSYVVPPIMKMITSCGLSWRLSFLYPHTIESMLNLPLQAGIRARAVEEARLDKESIRARA